MTRERRYLGLALVVAFPMAELGHALAYLLQGLPGDRGTHAYFPALLSAVEATSGAALLAALLVVSLGRLLNPGWVRRGRPVSIWPLLAALLSTQLVVFIFQETVELATVGQSPSGALAWWALAGQVPVALVAAFTLRWLSQRLEPALRALRTLPPLIAACWTPSVPAARAASEDFRLDQSLICIGRCLRAPPLLSG